MGEAGFKSRSGWLQVHTFHAMSSGLRSTSMCVVHPDTGQSEDQGAALSSGCRVTNLSQFAQDDLGFTLKVPCPRQTGTLGCLTLVPP